MKTKKLNFCCGNDIKEGYLNTDIKKPYDLRVDMDELPLPFKDNEFDEIYFKSSIIYSKKPYELMEELHRILKNGRKLTIIAIYWNYEGSYSDMNIRNRATWRSFDCFDIDYKGPKWYNDSNCKFKIKRKIKGLLPLPSRLLNFIGLYISNTAQEIVFEMIAIK